MLNGEHASISCQESLLLQWNQPSKMAIWWWNTCSEKFIPFFQLFFLLMWRHFDNKWYRMCNYFTFVWFSLLTPRLRFFHFFLYFFLSFLFFFDWVTSYQLSNIENGCGGPMGRWEGNWSWLLDLTAMTT